ncbi:MAG: GNAT family N-acetyltransferase [Crocinitomicaceae bacterium]|nr:GNAT family N-acetyltransferase [Crocinitomicaceae bacterium]
MIRKVKESDAPAICEMYNHYIRETVITFEEVELTSAEMLERIRKVKDKFFWLVYEEDGKILGYAYANTWRERVAYRYSIETSVYVAPKAKGKGIGKMLYKDLLNLLKEGGFKQIIGGITLPNKPSEKFHEYFGFKKVAHFSKVGLKFDQWHDVGFWQLDFSEE